MKHIHLFFAVMAAAIAASCGNPTTADLNPGSTVKVKCPSENFKLTCQVMTDGTSAADLLFASDGSSGYEVRFHGGAIDGTTKTGSLTGIRNRYRSIVPDNEWFNFELAVRGKNISVKLNDIEVVCYTEPEKPFRINEYSGMLLGKGECYFKGSIGLTKVKDIKISTLPEGEKNPSDTLPPVDEQSDKVIRLQQQGFPVIDYHVHLKGGLTKEIAGIVSIYRIVRRTSTFFRSTYSGTTSTYWNSANNSEFSIVIAIAQTVSENSDCIAPVICFFQGFTVDTITESRLRNRFLYMKSLFIRLIVLQHRTFANTHI